MTTQTISKTNLPADRRVATARAIPAAGKPRILSKNRTALRLLDTLMNCSEEEAQDQRETFEFLKKALDEDRRGYRELFLEKANEADVL